MRLTWGAKDDANTGAEQAQTLMQEAGAALERKDTAAARRLYSDSIQIYRSRGLKRQEADALHALALMLVTACEHAEAVAALSNSSELYRKLNLRGQLAVTLRDTGYALTDIGKFEEAQNLLSESLSLFEATGDKCGMASALEGQGIAAHEQQNVASAREYFQRSLSLHRELDLNPESAVSLIYLSILALSQNEIDSAEALYRESIERFKEDNPESSLIPPLITLGDVAFTTQESVQIGELLQAALAVFGASRLKHSWDSAMTKLGGVAQRRNVNRSALETYRHSLSVDPARDEWGSEAIACLGLGCVAYRQDKPKIGKALIARSLNLCRKHGDLDTIRYVLSYAAAYTYSCQHYPDSRQYHVQCAEAERDSADDVQTADAMCYAAFIASWLGDNESARKYCVDCIATYRAQNLQADTARAQSLLGTIFCNLGDTETGTKIHDEAVEAYRRINDTVGTALALSNMGASLTRTDAEAARKCLQESLEILEATDEGSDLDPDVVHNMAELDRVIGCHNQAFQLFCDSVEARIADSDRFGIAASLLPAGIIAVASGKFETGEILLAKAESIRSRLGIPIPAHLKDELAHARERLDEELQPPQLAKLAAEAESLSLEALAQAARLAQDDIVDPPVVEEEEQEAGDEVTEHDEPAAPEAELQQAAEAAS